MKTENSFYKIYSLLQAVLQLQPAAVFLLRKIIYRNEIKLNQKNIKMNSHDVGDDVGM